MRISDCSSDVCSSDLAMQVSPVTGASWHATGSTNPIVTRRVDSCGDLARDGMCLPDGGAEVCVEGPETRIINGVQITEAGWAWKRDYMCHALSNRKNCTALKPNPSLRLLRPAT